MVLLGAALLPISTLAPREGSDQRAHLAGHDGGISTLAPREGSDVQSGFGNGGRTISTLAPREGSDRAPSPAQAAPRYFYPRSPRGERHVDGDGHLILTLFLPSLPARGATTLASAEKQYPELFLPSLPARGAT